MSNSSLTGPAPVHPSDFAGERLVGFVRRDRRRDRAGFIGAGLFTLNDDLKVVDAVADVVHDAAIAANWKSWKSSAGGEGFL